MLQKRSVVIVSPALAHANNGNWQTAKRYAQLLSTEFHVRTVSKWDPQASEDVMIALHARRSAESIADWYAAKGSKGLIVVLTGTDLYRDIQQDYQAQQSLQWASCLIVLQAAGLKALPEKWLHKTQVILQSTTTRQTLPKTKHCVRALMVGHLRAEKSPQTFLEAAALLAGTSGILLRHIGGEHDAGLALQAYQTAQQHPHYQFLGEQSHGITRRHIQRAHVLVHASVMEGGAHVIMEAICSGVPVLASDIPGNVGMLGLDYAGYFPVGNASALSQLLLRFQNEPSFAEQLKAQCALRAPLFDPINEQTALTKIVTTLLHIDFLHQGII